MIYYGPRSLAADYFHSLGYEPQPRQTTCVHHRKLIFINMSFLILFILLRPDFLCSITDPNARIPIKDFTGYRPKTADEFATVFKESKFGRANVQQVQEAKSKFSSGTVAHYQSSARKEHEAGLTSKASKKRSEKELNPYVITYWQQTKLCIRRRLQLAWGNKPSLLIPIIVSVIQSIIIGSTFFRIPDSTSGFFSRGGVLFFAILFNAFQAMAEITVSYAQRPVIVRQRRFAMVHPSCVSISTFVSFLVKHCNLSSYVLSSSRMLWHKLWSIFLSNSSLFWYSM